MKQYTIPRGEDSRMLAPRPAGRQTFGSHPAKTATGIRLRVINEEIEESTSQPVPIWVAALFANHCRAKANGEDHDILWHCVGGRVLYTNRGCDTEQIEPLGVILEGGHTLAVSWVPGETGYKLEVFRQFDCCA
jgi:hypothetical protein